MDNLIIDDNSGEFFCDGKPLLTLNKIKTINLFIGANNTRKSRLMRKIAQLERKIVMKGVPDLNGLFEKSAELLTILKAKNTEHPNVELLHFKANRNQPDPKLKFARVQDFFTSSVAPVIRYSTFTEQIEKIITDLPQVKNDADILNLVDLIQKFSSLVEFMTYIYGEAMNGADINHNSDYGAWAEMNANSIQFRLPDRDSHGHILDLEFKLNMLMDIRMLMVRFSMLKPEISTPKGIYIPVLRSSRNLLNDAGNLAGSKIFSSTINLQYFNSITPPHNITVHTGQEHYELIDKAKRGVKKKRDDFAEFENFIGNSFYQSSEIEIIAHEGGKYPDIIVSLPNERPDIPIYDLGDGVQAIINLFFPIFTAKTGTWIYIDEPELNLHPGFQNLFIRTLLENEFLRTKQLRYFINSHSNHILSEVLLGGVERSEVYVFQRQDENSSNIIAFEGFENATLDLLGVLNTSTLISNCSVWVEGVTDRIYLRAFLTAFLKIKVPGYQPIEGLNYTFIEYGGKNLVHYIFDSLTKDEHKKNGIDAFFVNRKIFLLADTDTKKEEQHAYYRSLETDSFKFRETVVPEIENLLPQAVLALYLEKRLKLEKQQVAEILSVPYDKTKLGKFLSSRFKKAGIDIKIESATGGTLSSYYKSSLAEFVFQEVQNGGIIWSMLAGSQILKVMIINLYEFIAISNHQTDDDTLSPF